jgi:hypothetical protein
MSGAPALQHVGNNASVQIHRGILHTSDRGRARSAQQETARNGAPSSLLNDPGGGTPTSPRVDLEDSW